MEGTHLPRHANPSAAHEFVDRFIEGLYRTTAGRTHGSETTIAFLDPTGV
jgi:hypothetical protein